MNYLQLSTIISESLEKQYQLQKALYKTNCIKSNGKIKKAALKYFETQLSYETEIYNTASFFLWSKKSYKCYKLLNKDNLKEYYSKLKA